MSNSYDEMPYAAGVFRSTHPNTLATIGMLVGMEPPAVDRCRVLELGCANGNNLMAMAQMLPEGEFYGIDFSARQIDEGQAHVKAQGLENVTLRHGNIMDVSPELGQFDYIVTHGVFSWVPPEVQQKMFEICRELLAPNGIAYISYNTYPGWHANGMVRQMLLYHTENIKTAEERVRQSKLLIKFLAESTEPEKGTENNSPNIHNLMLKKSLKKLRDSADSYIFHEYLEDNNTPFLFHQFVLQAGRHNLQYMGDTDARWMSNNNIPEKILSQLRQLGNNFIRREQYLDFIYNRAFRRSLLCHRNVKLPGRLHPEALSQFYILSKIQPASPSPDLKAGVVEEFKDELGNKLLTTSAPLVKAICVCMHELFPKSIRFDDLIETVRDRLSAHNIALDATPEELRKHTISFVMRMYIEKKAVFFLKPPTLTPTPSLHPLASPMARRQAEQGKKTPNNLLGETVKLPSLALFLLPHLDGSADRNDLLKKLIKGIQKGVLRVDGPDAGLSPSSQKYQQHMRMHIDSVLNLLAKKAYLVS